MKKLTAFFVILIAAVFLAIPALAATVMLQWDANTEPDLTHYTAYFGNYSGNTRTFQAVGSQRTVGTETTITIPNLDPLKKWFFRVTASNSQMESLYSNFVNVNFIRTPANTRFQRVDIR